MIVSVDITGRALQAAVEETDRSIEWKEREIARFTRRLETLRKRRAEEWAELLAYDRDGTPPKRRKAQLLVERFTEQANRQAGIAPVKPQGVVAGIPDRIPDGLSWETRRRLGKPPTDKGPAS